MKKTLILSVAFISLLVFTACSKTSGQKQSLKKEDKNQNYTIKYALKHYKSYDELLKDNHPIQWVLSDKTYVIKGDGSSKHSGGWTFKEGKGVMLRRGHKRGKSIQIDYEITTDNKDVTTLGAIRKAFSEKK